MPYDYMNKVEQLLVKDNIIKKVLQSKKIAPYMSKLSIEDRKDIEQECILQVLEYFNKHKDKTTLPELDLLNLIYRICYYQIISKNGCSVTSLSKKYWNWLDNRLSFQEYIDYNNNKYFTFETYE